MGGDDWPWITQMSTGYFYVDVFRAAQSNAGLNPIPVWITQVSQTQARTVLHFSLLSSILSAGSFISVPPSILKSSCSFLFLKPCFGWVTSPAQTHRSLPRTACPHPHPSRHVHAYTPHPFLPLTLNCLPLSLHLGVNHITYPSKRNCFFIYLSPNQTGFLDGRNCAYRQTYTVVPPLTPGFTFLSYLSSENNKWKIPEISNS